MCTLPLWDRQVQNLGIVAPPVDFLALGDFTAKAMSALAARGRNPDVHPIKKPELLDLIDHQDRLLAAQV